MYTGKSLLAEAAHDELPASIYLAITAFQTRPTPGKRLHEKCFSRSVCFQQRAKVHTNTCRKGRQVH
ncbi:hypothetical protein Y1Q_0023848 [Alligator mississippiensis]|uniref:Uncharacterized protein n=1 Tax=Alligator mississippiensis TaxID=8496 RepID=A0A151MKG4_ALLMI|nr:hypothetical protein Y1Q_0023848 [Alligator mississippiensis]